MAGKKKLSCKKAFLFFIVTASSPLFSQIADAPDRPVCTSIEESGPGTCDFNEETELAGARVVLFESGGGHGTSRKYLRDALKRLSVKYGFILDSLSTTDFTEDTLNKAKVIIYSNNDGAGMPSGSQAQLIENFVKERGWGLLMIHAACAFNDWQFLQDACIQQFEHQYPEQTAADVYLVDSTYQDERHGLANPYTSFMLRGIAARQTMNDEWFSWRGNPLTTHQYNRQSENKIMLTALDESTISNGSCEQCNLYPGQHFISWTHTMGRGIVLSNSIGGTDTYQQSPNDFGDEMLWRQLRYVAKDWGAWHSKSVCLDSNAGNYDVDFDPNTEISDETVCRYCGDVGLEEYVPGKEVFQYDNNYCQVTGIEIPGVRNHEFIIVNNLNIHIAYTGKYRLQIFKTTGEIVLDVNGYGAKNYPSVTKEEGIYYTKLSVPGYKAHIQKLLSNKGFRGN